ncbi:MOSC domain-containing protein [Massilia sp. Mn16-1_5]|uniref:MOSC domain-containing protein n=1 Tax=Massilia sp. Mn16-1_5 TaxID=2079199 RepID=UPI00109E8128|nr:MOSC domain-containing protein [Massilia sp. Mn16-1_5]
MNLGRVVGLAARTSKAAAPQSVDSLRLLPGAGIEDEIHADPHSPRQLLLASRDVYKDFGLPPHALGENLLLETDTACLRSGTVLQIGDQVQLRMMFQCEACGQLDAVQPRLATRIGSRRGMLARVLAGGVIRAGDTVRDLGVLAQPWLDDWRERVRRVLDAVPEGSVVEYRVLARLAGIQSSYCRAFPRLLARLGPYYMATAVTAQSPAALPRWQGEGLFEQY